MNRYMSMLGHQARDKITGMTGVVTSVSFDLYGCVQIVLNPGLDKDGKVLESFWFDHKRLEIIGPRVMEPPSFSEPGDEQGPEIKPTRRAP